MIGRAGAAGLLALLAASGARAEGRLGIVISPRAPNRAIAAGFALMLADDLRHGGVGVLSSRQVAAALHQPTALADLHAAQLPAFAVDASATWLASVLPAGGPGSGQVEVRLQRAGDEAVLSSERVATGPEGARTAADGVLAALGKPAAAAEAPLLRSPDLEVLAHAGEALLRPQEAEMVLAALAAGDGPEHAAASLLAADLGQGAGSDVAAEVEAIAHRSNDAPEAPRLYARMRSAVEAGRAGGLKPEIARLRQLAPDAVDALALAGRAALLAGDPAQAKALLEQAQARAAWRPDLASALAEVDARLGDAAGAVAQREREVETLRDLGEAPEVAIALTRAPSLTLPMAAAFDAGGLDEKTRTTLTFALGDAGKGEAAAVRLVVLAEIARARGDLAGAAELLKKVAPAFAGHAAVVGAHLHLAVAQGDLGAARAWASRRKATPRDQWLVAKQLPRPGEAVALLRDVWQASRTPDVAVALASALERAGKPAEAAAVLRKAVEADPDGVEALEALAREEARAGQPKRAEHARLQALRLAGPGAARSPQEASGVKALLAGMPIASDDPAATPIRSVVLLWAGQGGGMGAPSLAGVHRAVQGGLSMLVEVKGDRAPAGTLRLDAPSTSELWAAVGQGEGADAVLLAVATPLPDPQQVQAHVRVLLATRDGQRWESQGTVRGGRPATTALSAAVRDWRPLAGGAAGALLLLVLLAKLVFRRKATLRVKVLVDDDSDGRFCVAVGDERAPAVREQLKQLLDPDADQGAGPLSSGLERLPGKVRRRLGRILDGVVSAASFPKLADGRYRVLLFGAVAPKVRLTMTPGGGLWMADEQPPARPVQERVIQISEAGDLEVTFDLRTRPSFAGRPRDASQPATPSRGVDWAATAEKGRASQAEGSRASVAIDVPPPGRAPDAPLSGVDVAGIAPPAVPVGQQAGRLGKQAFLEGRYEEAAEYFRQADDPASEARCYLFLGQSGRAARVEAESALRRGDHALALEHFLQAKDSEGAARCLRQLGREQEALKLEAEGKIGAGQVLAAAELLVRAREPARAAKLFDEAGELGRAVALYEEAGEWGLAARAYARQGDRWRAASAFSRAGMHAQAAELYRDMGEPTKAIEAFLVGGLKAAAAGLLYEMGRSDEAYALAQSVPPADPHAPQAALVLARVLCDRRQVAEIRQLAQRLVAQPLPAGQLEHAYLLADLLQGLEALPEARALLQLIANRDPGFLDVRARIEALGGLVDQELAAAQARKAPDATQARLEPGATQARVDLGATQARVDPGATRSRVEIDPAWDAPAAMSTSPVAVPPAPGLPTGGQQRYRIEAELGRGAMGIVHRATDTLLGRPVAIKVLPPAFASGAEITQMFLAEARALAALNHPHIVQIYDMGELQGALFLAMEFLDGETLEQLLGRVPVLPLPAALGTADQIADALDCAHRAKVVHRDVKPANIMVGKNGQMKLMDFGIAHMMAAQAGSRTVARGTPLYMSPEQVQGVALDGRSDLYSLGVVLYRMLTGKLPFESGDVPAQHVGAPPPPPRSIKPDLAPEAEALLLQLLAKDPARRPQSAAELRTLLARVHQVVKTSPPI